MLIILGVENNLDVYSCHVNKKVNNGLNKCSPDNTSAHLFSLGAL